MSEADSIKRMKLYRHPERVYNDLRSAGFQESGLLKEKDVSYFDQYHYFGTDALDEAIDLLKIDSKKRIIEIGSGIGGCARYLAEKTGCHLTAVEIQPDLDAIASYLSARCSLSGLIRHVRADILDFRKEGDGYDIAVSWLSFLHIPDRQALLKKCYSLLKPGGQIFIEDYYKRNKFTKEEADVLREDVYCPYLPAYEEYKEQLAGNGFTNIEMSDKTECWKNFVKERMRQFGESRDRQVKVHGIDTVNDLEDFYKKVSRLFEGNNLGGLRISAKKQP